MSSNINTIVKKPKIITWLCPNGYFFEYYDSPDYDAVDHIDIRSSACNDPENQP